MSRLDFAPNLKDVKITDIKKGITIFTPKPDKMVSFSKLKSALEKAGYELASAEITLTGTLARDDGSWSIVADPSGQSFALEGANLEQTLGGAAAGARVELTGDWKTVGNGNAAREVITPRQVEKIAFLPRLKSEFVNFYSSIRTTNPGLTVYKGGSVVPTYYYTSQHLGGLEVRRNTVQLTTTYTPTSKMQFEAEQPFTRTTSEIGSFSNTGSGFGNLTLRMKYRFFRELAFFGDQQAAVRFGLELPSGKSSAPSERRLPVSSFVRQQLTPINGGLTAHIDASYSQARQRFVFGGNIEGIIRSERDGYRLGHEFRLNTDLEYVFLPLKYRSPTKELFLILETSFVKRGLGRVGGMEVQGSRSTEYFLAPALQYVATPKIAIQTSVQFPVFQDIGPQLLRTDRSVMVSLRYLF